ncbi:hypothetical protein ABW20_dc0104268 [Dactylellina cionopaga]|nr:hypothetical protein ABW20_dc0104268 [Dactylellina cionopaga]
MVLKSRNLQVWIERPTSDICPATHLPHYAISPTFSPNKSTQQILPSHSLLVQEAYVEACTDAPYRVAFRVPPHWKNVGIQLIIDGVEQGNYISFNRFRSHESRISGRRVEKTSERLFKFSKMKIEDGCGNYEFDEKAHCRGGYINNNIAQGEIQPIEFMVGKKAVGTIRVNIYRVGKMLKGGACKGNGDWNPCTVVDDIGALKMQAAAESITTLEAPTKCSPATTMYAEFLDRYPFETFVLKYRPYEALANENLLVIKRTGLSRLAYYATNLFKTN